MEVPEEFETQPIWRFGVDRTLGLGLGETEEMSLEKMGISIHLDMSFPGAPQEFLLM